ncbi:hypothetical protein P4S72_13830 [Vibrio sp. PP-XX7]
MVVVISHDDRYFHLADQLLKFENGEIVENYRPERAQPKAVLPIDNLSVTFTI